MLKVFKQDDSKGLIELDLKKIDNGEELQQIIGNNLNVLFKNLILIDTKFRIDDFHIDILAYDNENDCFVLIKCKNTKNETVSDHIFAYYGMINEHPDKFVFRYNEKHREQKPRFYDDFNWEESYVITISTKFTKYQRIVAKEIEQLLGQKARFFEISRHNNETIILNEILTSKSSRTVKNHAEIDKNPILSPHTEEEYLAGKYRGRPDETSRKLYEYIKQRLFALYEDVYINVTTTYIGFRIRENDSYLCTVDLQGKKINLWLSVKKDSEVLVEDDFIKISEKGHWGRGEYRSYIENNDHIHKAMEYIKKVYEYKMAESN